MTEFKRLKKVAGCLQWFLVTHLRATERHLPYAITQCYLPPDTGERSSTHLTLIPARRAGTLSTKPGGMEG